VTGQALTAAAVGSAAHRSHTLRHTAAAEGLSHGSHREPKGVDMPIVNIRVIEEVFTAEEKQQMLTGVTEALVAVEGENVRPYTVVIIEEVHSRDYAVGGQPLSTGDVQTLRAATAKAS
jgi:4-oxalocrotonate tautomerase